MVPMCVVTATRRRVFVCVQLQEAEHPAGAVRGRGTSRQETAKTVESFFFESGPPTKDKNSDPMTSH